MQLDSFIEKWKTEGVNVVFLSGYLASTKQFVEKVQQNFPDMLLMSDNQDTSGQAQQEQAGRARSRTRTRASSPRAARSPQEYEREPELEVLHRHLQEGHRQAAPGPRRRRSSPRVTREDRSTPTARSTTRASCSRCSTTSASRVGQVPQQHQLDQHRQQLRSHREPGFGAVLVAAHRQVLGRRQLAARVVSTRHSGRSAFGRRSRRSRT